MSVNKYNVCLLQRGISLFGNQQTNFIKKNKVELVECDGMLILYGSLGVQ